MKVTHKRSKKKNDVVFGDLEYGDCFLTKEFDDCLLMKIEDYCGERANIVRVCSGETYIMDNDRIVIPQPKAECTH